MPQFVIDCSATVLTQAPSSDILAAVFEVAKSTGLFKEADIKVRIRSFEEYVGGRAENDFLHVFAYILSGRTPEQKRDLSGRVVAKLAQLLPQLDVLSMNVSDFDRETYCNRSMV